MKRERDKRGRSDKGRDRRMKKALAGPAKRTAKPKGLPERRAMIAAARRWAAAALDVFAKRTRQLDRALALRIERARPPLSRAGRRAVAVAKRGLARAWALAARLSRPVARRLRPLLALVLRAFSHLERALLALARRATRLATRASAVVTPRRAICAVVVASAACLIVAQFVSYRSVEIGQPGYAGLPSAAPPTVDGKAAGEVSAYALVPIAVLAALAGLLALRPGRRGLARLVTVLGLLAIAVILLVDLPAGLDASAQSTRFAGATAVLEPAFYAQLAAAGGLVLAGLLYTARPCRIRINLSGTVASARRRRRRRPASSRRRVARRPSPRRSAGASAPASRP